MTPLRHLRANRAFYLALGVTTALVAMIIMREKLLHLPLPSIGLVATFVVFAALATVPALTPRRMLSAGFIYVLMLILFHLSIPVVQALGGTVPGRFASYINTWYDSRYVVEAIYLSMIAVMALVTAFAWEHVRRERHNETRETVALPTAPPGFARLGAALVLAGVGAYLGLLALIAPELLTGGTYQEYLDSVAGTRMVAGANLLVSMGICLAAVSGAGRARTVAWLAFGLFAVITMSFGSRTAAMFPAVAGLVAAAAATGRQPRVRTATAIILAGLLSITVVQQVRETGVSAATVSAVSLNPMGSFAETGGTVRTVAEVVKWRRAYQEPQYNGITYATPVIRFWERLTGQPRPEGVEDRRYAGVLLQQRFPDLQLGFSPVAEAFLNFGTLGVVLIFGAFGALLGSFDSRRLSYLSAARLGVGMYALGYTVRNASNMVPVTITIGFLIIWLAAHLATKSSRDVVPAVR